MMLDPPSQIKHMDPPLPMISIFVIEIFDYFNFHHIDSYHINIDVDSSDEEEGLSKSSHGRVTHIYQDYGLIDGEVLFFHVGRWVLKYWLYGWLVWTLISRFYLNWFHLYIEQVMCTCILLVQHPDTVLVIVFILYMLLTVQFYYNVIINSFTCKYTQRFLFHEYHKQCRYYFILSRFLWRQSLLVLRQSLKQSFKWYGTPCNIFKDDRILKKWLQPRI